MGARLGAVARVALFCVASLLAPWELRGDIVDAGAADDPPARFDAVSFAGCEAVLDGPRCELGADRTLRLWTSNDVAAVLADGSPVAVESAPLDGGRRDIVHLAEGAKVVIVVLGIAGARATWSLALAPPRPARPIEEEVKSLRERGDLVAAADRARAALGTASGVDRASLLGLLARVELARGDADAAAPVFRDAIAANVALGRWSDAAHDAFALSFSYQARHRFTEARAALAEGERFAHDFPEGQAMTAYFGAIIAQETGDHRRAVAELGAAGARAKRLGMGRLSVMIREARALELVRLGRAGEAFVDLSRLLDDVSIAPCDRANIEVNAAFAALRMARALPAPGAPDDPRADVDRALARDRGSCAKRARILDALANRAWLALRDGDVGMARRSLDEACAVEATPAIGARVDRAELAASIALAERRWKDAEAAFDEEAALAPSSGDGESAWRAEAGRAKALIGQGRRRDALAALERAEAGLDATSRSVPLGEGREAYLGQGDDVTAERVGLLVDLGENAAALRALRHARSRALFAVERGVRISRLAGSSRARWDAAVARYWTERDGIERDAVAEWRLPVDRVGPSREVRAARAGAARAELETELAGALADPRATAVAGEAELAGADAARPAALTLAFFQARGETAVFADDGARVDVVRAKERAAGGASAWLEPLRARIEAAARIDVVAYGAARAVDVHAITFDGEPLVARAPVVYRLDLPRTSPADGDGAGDRRALVVGDPTMDLGASRAETKRVAAALRASAWQVDVLTGDAATSSALRAAIGRASLFHYAGHGSFAGDDGWGSALPLAGGGELSVEDVLALPHVPARVLLFGCETARSGDAAFEGLGLAHAFLAGGAREVVAATRRIDDALAGAMSEAMHAHLAAGESLPESLRAAQLAVRARDPRADWAAFRVIAR